MAKCICTEISSQHDYLHLLIRITTYVPYQKVIIKLMLAGVGFYHLVICINELVSATGPSRGLLLQFEKVLMYSSRRPPDLDTGSYFVVVGQWYASHIFQMMYPFSTALAIYGVHHVPVMALFASGQRHTFLDSASAHIPHRGNFSFPLDTYGRTGW